MKNLLHTDSSKIDGYSTESNPFISSNLLRAEFSRKLSLMYQTEVPLYSELLSLVADINQSALSKNDALYAQLRATGELDRLDIERHGAIRVGTAAELNRLKRLFALFGMQPVGYYDLATAGVPVHSTAFRAVSLDDLNISPFRIFTSLLRLDLIKGESLRLKAESILAKRNIFSSELISLISQAEHEDGVSASYANQFIDLSVDIFRWHAQATVDHSTYNALHQEHRLIADVISFQGPHINHLTPRALDIDSAQNEMPKRNIPPKATIEGPPKRKCPILLRQTSFHALEEAILFKDDNSEFKPGKHTARFGEIEQRGAALTAEGRHLYDQLLNQANQQFTETTHSQAATAETATQYYDCLAEVFQAFPDNWQTLHDEKLAWFYYYLAEPFNLVLNEHESLLSGTEAVKNELRKADVNDSLNHSSHNNNTHNYDTHNYDTQLNALNMKAIADYRDFCAKTDFTSDEILLQNAIQLGLIHYAPIVYEDFLPVSAAGIFQSNLGQTERVEYAADANKTEFEQALGCNVADEMQLYANEQQRSISHCVAQLNVLIQKLTKK